MSPAHDTLRLLQEYFNISTLEYPAPIEIRNTTRNDLAKFFGFAKMQQGIEIGVESARFSQVLAQENPGIILHGVDPWGASLAYRPQLEQERWDEIFYDATTRMASYDWRPLRMTSAAAAKSFADASLDFVYIDGNHALDSVLEDLAIWTTKIRPGGIISGHDYTKTKQRMRNDVVKAVNQWVTEQKITPWFILGVRDRTPGEVCDVARSYFWVKE